MPSRRNRFRDMFSRKPSEGLVDVRIRLSPLCIDCDQYVARVGVPSEEGLERLPVICREATEVRNSTRSFGEFTRMR